MSARVFRWADFWRSQEEMLAEPVNLFSPLVDQLPLVSLGTQSSTTTWALLNESLAGFIQGSPRGVIKVERKRPPGKVTTATTVVLLVLVAVRHEPTMDSQQASTEVAFAQHHDPNPSVELRQPARFRAQPGLRSHSAGAMEKNHDTAEQLRFQQGSSACRWAGGWSAPWGKAGRKANPIASDS